MADGRIGVEEVFHHLLQQADAGEFAFQQAHRALFHLQFLGEFADPGRVEGAGFQQGPDALAQGFVLGAELHAVVRQVQPGTAGLDAASCQGLFQQGDKHWAFQLGQGVAP
ncbi:hypothetical protein FQZ97_1046330 [compost metagenome]